MATTLASAVKLAFSGTLTQSPALGTTGHNLSYSQTFNLLAGTGLSQANLIYENTYTIAASSSTTINLTSLTDALGNSISFAKVKALLVFAYAANTNDVLVGNAGSNQWYSWCDAATDVVKVKPGGLFCLVAPTAAGYTVTASTAINLMLANSSSDTGVTLDLVLIGA